MDKKETERTRDNWIWRERVFSASRGLSMKKRSYATDLTYFLLSQVGRFTY